MRYPFNYGMLPQTWESEYDTDPYTGLPGDKDPIDAIEISGYLMKIVFILFYMRYSLQAGSVYEVKVLGAMGMLDDGETDWKLIVLNTDSDLDYEDITGIRFKV